MDINFNANNASTQQKCHFCGFYFSISSAFLVVVTYKPAEYHMGTCNTVLVKP